MNVHPYCEAWPMMSEGEAEALTMHIKEHGLQQPLQTWNGQLIDGRNRLRACESAGITPKFKDVSTDYPAESQLLNYLIGINLRRNVKKAQRACAAFLVLEKSDAKERQSKTKFKVELSILFDVNPNYIAQAETLYRKNEKMFKEVQIGKTGLKAALDFVNGVKKPNLEKYKLDDVVPLVMNQDMVITLGKEDAEKLQKLTGKHVQVELKWNPMQK